MPHTDTHNDHMTSTTETTDTTEQALRIVIPMCPHPCPPPVVEITCSSNVYYIRSVLTAAVFVLLIMICLSSGFPVRSSLLTTRKYLAARLMQVSPEAASSREQQT